VGRSLSLLAVAVFAGVLGCAHENLPRSLGASLGRTNKGALLDGAEVPRRAEGLKWLRPDDHHHGLPRFAQAIERAAAQVARERPGSTLSVGDLSARHGGRLIPHFSHQSGRDADLLLYMTTLDGTPVDSPGFIHVEADGLAWDPLVGRFLRFDVEREWLLVESLLEDQQAMVQWIFVSEVVEALLVEWARARGSSPEIILRAQAVMLQPNPGGVHDDHIHVRTDCMPEDIARGCEPVGPVRPWLQQPGSEDVAELVAALLAPIDS
jgi:penicillin-insensitive murein DD-endopeptidase